MGYISDIRKFVGHSPIMATAALGIIYDEDKKSEMTLATDSTFTYNNIEYIVLRQGRKTPNGGTKDFWASC